MATSPTQLTLKKWPHTIIEVPFPPSTNTYWRHIVMGGRPRTLISKKGREYREILATHALVQRAAIWPRQGNIRCKLDLYPPDKRRRDVDNYAKALLDAMTNCGIYEDDSQIKELTIRMHEKEKPGRVVVSLEMI